MEFGLVALPLLIIILGIIEFGWLFNAQITVTSAAREGARTGAVQPSDELVRSAVKNHISSSGLYNVADEDIHVDRENGEVTVIVDGSLRPLIGFFVRDPVHLQGSAIMRLEYLINN